MKKVSLLSLMVILIMSVSLPAQDTCSDDYIKAMSANSPSEKYSLLKAWAANCSGKGIQYENFAYAYLCTIPAPEKTPQETVTFGEKALSLGGLDDLTQYSILITVASTYVLLGNNLSKARDYGGQAIKLATANKNKGADAGDPAQWNQRIGAGHYIQAQAYEKEKNFKAAVTPYINSYNILKNKQIASDLAKIGQSLYNTKSYSDAEKALKVASTVINDFGTVALYAKCLHRGGKKSEALVSYKQAYTKQKNGEIAYNIGLILAGEVQQNGTSANDAIKYLLDASFLSSANSKQAMSLAESLYFSNVDKTFNDKVKLLGDKNKEQENLTAAFNKKFGEKDEEELTDAEKTEMNSMLKKLEGIQGEIEKLQTDQATSLEKWQQLVDQAKLRLGIK
ncbi:MAG: hypothetical protein MUP98_05620 [Candidatus Aminicenantes bacterium]|nr:hypothetical protein [Candidatus Aminicenantes bacterium]